MKRRGGSGEVERERFQKRIDNCEFVEKGTPIRHGVITRKSRGFI